METLPGHGGLITCVQFIRDDLFVSADENGLLKCWRNFGSEACIIYSNSGRTNLITVDLQWKATGITQAHSKPVSAIAVLDQCLVTGGSDSNVKIWKLSSSETSGMAVCLQKL